MGVGCHRQLLLLIFWDPLASFPLGTMPSPLTVHVKGLRRLPLTALLHLQQYDQDLANHIPFWDLC